MAWEKLADVTSSVSDTVIDTGTITPLKYLVYQVRIVGLTGAGSNIFRFNGDTSGGNYNWTFHEDNGSDSYGNSQNEARIGEEGNKDSFAHGWIQNIDGVYSLGSSNAIRNMVTGSANEPQTSGAFYQWQDTDQIISIQYSNDASAIIGTASNLSVWGSD